jgi:molybdate transport system substrate-binding protein
VPTVYVKRGFVAVSIISVIFLLFLCGCRDRKAQGENELTVAAAANLAVAFDEIGAAFSRQTGCTVRLSLAASGILAGQIENGAPFDVFASADETFTDKLLAGNHLISDTVQPFALGMLVLAWSAEHYPDLSLTGLADLLEHRVKKVALANPAHAPFGRAAKEALKNGGLWYDLQPKLVYGNNVRDALNLITTGNAEAGLAALSLVTGEDKISYMPVDLSLYTPPKQTIAVVSGTSREKAARDFVAFVLSDEGRRILENHGIPPSDR